MRSARRAAAAASEFQSFMFASKSKILGTLKEVKKQQTISSFFQNPGAIPAQKPAKKATVTIDLDSDDEEDEEASSEASAARIWRSPVTSAGKGDLGRKAVGSALGMGIFDTTKPRRSTEAEAKAEE